MTARANPRPRSAPRLDLPRLHNGDRLTQAEFHRRYQAMPEDVKAELIGGIVYMTSPLHRPHGKHHFLLSGALVAYEAGTPGLEGLDNTTTVLGDESEPQPDLSLRVLPERGGQSWTSPEGLVQGPPELVAEVADSSASIDLHGKKDDYQRAGVREYLVLVIREKELRAFDLVRSRDLAVDRDGVYRSRVFPGLWIDVRALLRGDARQLLATVQKGLATPEHRAFVKKLAAAKKRPGAGRGSPKRRPRA